MQGGNRKRRVSRWPSDPSLQDFQRGGHSLLPHQQTAFALGAPPPGWGPQSPLQFSGGPGPSIAPWGIHQQFVTGGPTHNVVQGGRSNGGGGFAGSSFSHNLEKAQVSQELSRRPENMSSPPENLCFQQASWGKGPVMRIGLLSRDEKLSMVEELASRFHQDLVTGANAVSVRKVLEKTLLALGVPSFETIGLMLEDIPCLRKLILLESKVNALIHSHVAVEKICTLYDLSLDVCCNEGVRDFQDLGLGPLLCNPLVVHYFSPSAGVELHKITAGEVIQHLSVYIHNSGKQFQSEGFLSYVAHKRSLPTPQHLCVRIQNLGMYIGLIFRAKRVEKELRKVWESRAKAEISEKRKSNIIARANSFLSAERYKDGSLGKRKFPEFAGEASLSSPSDNGDEEHTDGALKSLVGNPQGNNSRNTVRCSSLAPPIPGKCPYPSAGEERARLKKQELQQFVADSKQDDFLLSGPELLEFVAILKDACGNDSLQEVLKVVSERCQKFKSRKRSRKSKIFKAYPGIGLLNVAVLCAKAGYWDSMYTNFLDIADATNGPLNEQIKTVEVAAPIDVEDTCKKDTKCTGAKSTEEIAAAIAEHYKEQIVENGLYACQNRSRVWWLFLHWIYECESWIAEKYAVDTFNTLGFGSFPHFLEENLQLLPSQIMSTMDSKSKRRQGVVKVPKKRVLSFLFQALPVLSESGSHLEEHMFGLLCSQFKVSSIEELGASSLESLLDTCKEEQVTLPPSHHARFLAPLAVPCGKDEIREACPFTKHGPEDDVYDVSHGTRVGVLGSKTSADAVKCLLSTPFLTSISQWSQWDSVFAPTLGPLLDWFEKEGSISGLHAIVTCEGNMLRIQETVTTENFLLATMKGRGDEMAAVLVSLVALYGGKRNMPTALLVSQALKGLEILLGSYGGDFTRKPSCSPCILRAERKFPELIGGQVLKVSSIDAGNMSMACDDEKASGGFLQTGSDIGEGESPFGLQRSVASRCLIECLCYMIPELRIFTAQILLSAFSNLIADPPVVLLESCLTFQERSILHGLGLGLGILEWTNDYKCCTRGPSRPLAASTLSGVEDVGWRNMENRLVTAHVPKSDGSKECEGVDMVTNQVSRNWEGNQLKRSPECSTDKSIVVDQISNVLNESGSTSRAFEMGPLEAHAKKLIEEIRHHEFGMGQDVQGKELDLLTRQHARMGRALHRLSSDLYSQDSHFVLELVQNADDNDYSPGLEAAIVFVIQKGRIVVLNNESGFTAANIRALCDVGHSTKEGKAKGYIGHKGIGFKSVFRVTNAPEIHSNGFHIKFDISEGDIGFILPTCILPPPACDSLDSIITLLCDKEMPKYRGNCWNTRISLPVKASLEKEAEMNLLASKFNDLHPSLLLFLQRLRCIAVCNSLTGSMMVMHREDLQGDLVKVTHEKGSASWVVVRRQLKATVLRPGSAYTEIALAFQLNEVSVGSYEADWEQQQVFAFLPLRGYGLRFIVQGDFKVPSSREEIDCDSDWNQWLRSEIPDIFIQSFKSFQKAVASDCPAKAVSSFMRLVPMEGEVLGFFSPLPRMILCRLRTSPCLPVEGGGWALPCLLLRCWSSATRELLGDGLLREHLGLRYLDKDVILPDILASKLGVQQFGVDPLVAVMKSICEKGTLVNLGLNWVRDWLLALHDCLESDQWVQDARIYEDKWNTLRLELRSLPYIPLSNGLYTSLSDGHVWFAGELSEDGHGVNSVVNKFLHLSVDLRIVHHGLLSGKIDSVPCEESLLTIRHPVQNSLGKAVKTLQRLGVSRLSLHDVLKIHVLPAMAKEDCLLKDHLLVVEYLGFVKSHLQSNCVTCNSERSNLITQVKECAVILTNNGLIRAGQQPVHFGSEMGNKISDIKQILEGTNISWIEVSPVYLQSQLQDTDSDLTSWRIFFKDLGVTDFVKVVFSDKEVVKKSSSMLKTCVWEEQVAQRGRLGVQDWYSEELAELLVNPPDSTKGASQRRNCIFLERLQRVLLALDGLWDDYYFQFCQAFYSPNDGSVEGPKSPTASSFQLLLQQRSWVMSSLDGKLHKPTELFQCSDSVKSILGSNAPFLHTKIQSEGFVKALGLRTDVSVDDVLHLLQYWGHCKGLFEASLAQMTRLYTFLLEKLPGIDANVLSDIRSGALIFVPQHWNNSNEDIQMGSFYPPGRVCWRDPADILDLVHFDQETSEFGPATQLSNIYQGLHDFFVGVCCVQEEPDFDLYLEVLQKLASEQPPSAVLHHFMKVFCLWSTEIGSGKVQRAEILRWKSQLEERERCIFATDQDKWVSINNASGFVCICDDEKLGEQFSDSLESIHFILMTDDDLLKVSKQSRYQESNNWSLQPLVQALCIPKLSEAVERKVIKYGLHVTGKVEALVGWVLPFVQRYIKQHFIKQYEYLQQTGILEVVRRLQIVVVDELYFQYLIRGSRMQSSKRIHCTCILEDNTLHVVEEFVHDYCNIYVELSRLFFGGKSNNSVSNFLHLITLMLSSGSSESEVENFILNQQGIKPILDGDDIWNLCTEAGASPLNGLSNSGWPPSSAKPVATSERVAASSERGKLVRREEAVLNGYEGGPQHLLIDGVQSLQSENLQQRNAPMREMRGSNQMPFFQGGHRSSAVNGLQDASSVHRADSKRLHVKEAVIQSVVFENLLESGNTANFDGRDFLVTHPVNEEQREITGRLGETLVFEYLCRQHGAANVKWLNQDVESGAPYDIVVQTDSAKQEFVEVKATRSGGKDWFEISPQEWEFATIHAKSYSIMRIFLSHSTQHVKLLRLPNPVKLAQDRIIQLALLIPSPGGNAV